MNRIDPATLPYVGAILATRDLGPLKRWLTTRCPQCEQEPPADNTDHIVLRGYVVVSCKDYFLINPAALGMNVPDWIDWRRVRPNVSVGIWCPTGEPDTPAVRAKTVITVELLAHAGEPGGSVRQDLLRALHGLDFEVQSDSVGDPNGFQTIEIIAQ